MDEELVVSLIRKVLKYEKVFYEILLKKKSNNTDDELHYKMDLDYIYSKIKDV